MRAQTYNLASEQGETYFLAQVGARRLAGKSATVQFVPEKRSLPQNSYIWKLYGQIATQAEDLTVVDVMRYCKLHYGIPLLRANNPEFQAFYDANLKGLSYEAKIMLMDYMDVTSRKEFTKEMGSEFLDTIIREYSKQGYSLIHPGEAGSEANRGGA